MYAAAAKKGGAGGVSREVAKEFVAHDQGGKLPERKGEGPRMAKQWKAKARDGKNKFRKPDAADEKPAAKPGFKPKKSSSSMYTGKKDGA